MATSALGSTKPSNISRTNIFFFLLLRGQGKEEESEAKRGGDSLFGNRGGGGVAAGWCTPGLGGCRGKEGGGFNISKAQRCPPGKD